MSDCAKMWNCVIKMDMGFGDSLPLARKLAVCFVLAKMLVKLLPMASWDLDLTGTE